MNVVDEIKVVRQISQEQESRIKHLELSIARAITLEYRSSAIAVAWIVENDS